MRIDSIGAAFSTAGSADSGRLRRMPKAKSTGMYRTKKINKARTMPRLCFVMSCKRILEPIQCQ